MAQNATSAQTAVTTGATLILDANSDATYRRISSSGTVFVGVAGVGTASGFILRASDPPMEMSGSGFVPGAGIYTGPLWAIATTTGSTIYAFQT